MRNISASVCCVLAVLFVLTLCADVSAQPRDAYPWEMPLEEIGKFSALTYEAGGIKVTFTEGHCGPIIIKLPDESGTPVPKVTGLEVLGKGHVTVKMEEETLMDDDIYGAMFRFHPDDYQTFVSITDFTETPDAGLRSLLLHMCYGSFRRFWHRGMQAFVPDAHVGAAWVYAKQEGGVMIWQNDKELKGYCMDTKKELFKR